MATAVKLHETRSEKDRIISSAIVSRRRGSTARQHDISLSQRYIRGKPRISVPDTRAANERRFIVISNLRIYGSPFCRSEDPAAGFLLARKNKTVQFRLDNERLCRQREYFLNKWTERAYLRSAMIFSRCDCQTNRDYAFRTSCSTIV